MSDESFKNRFLKKFKDGLESYGTSLPVIYKNPETRNAIQHEINILGAAIGRKVGAAQRENILKNPFSGLELIMMSFQQDMLRRGINVHYGLTDKPNELAIEVQGCIFQVNDLEPHCFYSIEYLKELFDAEKVDNNCSIAEGADYCEFTIQYQPEQAVKDLTTNYFRLFG